MRNIAVIAAAGWKGTSSNFPDVAPGTPESLLPLGNGETLLSRQVRQLRARGFVPFIGVGEPGCRYHWWARYQATHPLEAGGISEEGAKQGSLVSPWTEERVEYVRSLGTPVLCPDPGGTSHHETYRLILEAADYDWERAFFSHGDMLISDALLDDFLALSWPCHVVYRLHTWLVLNPAAARVYCQDVVTRRDEGGELAGGLFARMWDTRENDWATALHAVAPLVVGSEVFPDRASEFMDVDNSIGYRRALEWVQELKNNDTTAVGR